MKAHLQDYVMTSPYCISLANYAPCITSAKEFVASRKGRRNWLFAGHPNAAHAAATLYSLIVTAKACGLDPYQYFRFLFSKIPYAKTEEDFRALMPRNLTPEILSRFMTAT